MKKLKLSYQSQNIEIGITEGIIRIKAAQITKILWQHQFTVKSVLPLQWYERIVWDKILCSTNAQPMVFTLASGYIGYMTILYT